MRSSQISRSPQRPIIGFTVGSTGWGLPKFRSSAVTVARPLVGRSIPQFGEIIQATRAWATDSLTSYRISANHRDSLGEVVFLEGPQCSRSHGTSWCWHWRRASVARARLGPRRGRHGVCPARLRPRRYRPCLPRVRRCGGQRRPTEMESEFPIRLLIRKPNGAGQLFLTNSTCKPTSRSRRERTPLNSASRRCRLEVRRRGSRRMEPLLVRATSQAARRHPM